MNFKEHFEKFEADLRKRIMEEDELRESLKELTLKHDELVDRLAQFMAELKAQKKMPEDPFLNNDEFKKLMQISNRTSQLWRDESQISYSQISGKIYFRMSDIRKLLDNNYFKSVEKERKDKKK
jgi:hypothetical protein